MKIISLMRHAKSSWKDGYLHDLERPLMQKGYDRTRLIVNYLKERNFNPEYILSSHALRAMETAGIVTHAFGIKEECFRVEKKIYTADENEFFDLCFDIPEKITHVLMVGHNPALTGFANFFLNPKIDYMPTSGVVSIEFNAENWANLSLSSFQVRLMVAPKMIV